MYELPHNYYTTIYNRNSMDTLIQKPGRKLISLCIENNLCIQNGRAGGILMGDSPVITNMAAAWLTTSFAHKN